MLWRGVHQAALAADSGAEPHLPQTTVHWHAEPVRCLEFSSDGTYLLSGAFLLPAGTEQLQDGVCSCIQVPDCALGSCLHCLHAGCRLRSLRGDNPSRAALVLIPLVTPLPPLL